MTENEFVVFPVKRSWQEWLDLQCDNIRDIGSSNKGRGDKQHDCIGQAEAIREIN